MWSDPGSRNESADNMDQLPLLKSEDGCIHAWLKQFEVRCTLHNVEEDKMILWCQSFIGPQGLEVVAPDPS